MEGWVDDQLHQVLGYSASHLVDFVVALAKKVRMCVCACVYECNYVE